MTYVFINPVTAMMTDEGALNRALSQKGYARVYCHEDHAADVLEQARAALGESPVLDTRCPMAVRLIPKDLLCVTAPTLPILLECGRELSGREELSDGEIIVTTPCQALVAQGNALSLPRTRFMTAREFLSILGNVPTRAIESSPIPMGFYDCLGVNVLHLTGEDAIRAGLKDIDKDIELVEMLYCPDGCHRGDGL